MASLQHLLLLALCITSALGQDQEPCIPPAPNSDDALDYDLGGQVVKPTQPLTVQAWKGDATQPGFVFPELSDGEYGIPDLQAKPNFGIGVSGGGLRATSLGIGWIRAMHDLKLLNKARYFGSASGGGFLAAMVSYTPSAELTYKLGKYIPPKDATVKALSKLTRGTFATTIANITPSFYQTFVEQEFEPSNAGPSATTTDAESVYCRTVSLCTLKPLGLGWFNSTVSMKGTRGGVDKKVQAQAQKLGLKVYTVDSTAPMPILTGNILDSTEQLLFFPWEQTPLYSGAPCNFSQYSTQLPKGGGLVEPLGFNAFNVSFAAPPAVGSASTLQASSRFIQPLVGQVSVTGGIMAAELMNLIRSTPNNTNNSFAFGQPVYSTFNFQDYSSLLYPFADGGYSDNEGLIAMLRRKVKKILIFYAIATATTDKAEWSKGNSGLSQPFGRCQECYTYLSANLTDNVLNNASRVFQQQDEFDRLFDEYQANLCAGRVNTFNATLDVIENKFLGVPGGWKVDLMIVMNARVQSWEDKLPKGMQDLLYKSRNDPKTLARARLHSLQTNDLVDFPYFNIGIFNYNQLAASALSQLASWSVYQLEDEIRAFIAK